MYTYTLMLKCAYIATTILSDDYDFVTISYCIAKQLIQRN